MLYLALATTSFRRAMTYRAATLAGLATNFFFGLLRIYVLIALYAGSERTQVGGLDLTAAITYAALGQALLAPVLIFGSYEVMTTIRSGEIITDLTRPMDFYASWLARDLGRAAFHILGRGVPLFLVYPLIFDLVWPTSTGQWLAFALSVVMAVVVSFSWRFLVNCAAFWTVDARGVGRFAFLSMLLVSGLVIPLAFFPDWMQVWVRGLPFAAFINTPAEVFMGLVTGPALWASLLGQLFWVVALVLAARWVYARGVGHLVVQGG